jgi:hypothetical protein
MARQEKSPTRLSIFFEKLAKIKRIGLQGLCHTQEIVRESVLRLSVVCQNGISVLFL